MNTTVDGLLSAIPIFQGLGPEALESLTAIGNIITLPPGTPVFAEGDPADCLYLILEGSVAVSKKDEGGTPHVVSSLAEGGCFGEMSLIGESVRDTTTRTTDQTTCFIISRDEFIRLLSEVPKLIPAIFASIIDKVASFNQKFLLELCEKQKLSDDLARERFRSISYIASMANEAPSTDQALRIVLDQLCEYIQWPAGHAYLRDNSMSDSLLSSRLWHVNDQEKYLPFVRASEMIRFEDGVGLPGCVFTRGKAVWVRDIAGDLVCPRAPEARKTGLVSAFAFPVFVDGELMAVLEFFSREKMEVDRVLLDATDQIGVQLGRLIERKNLEKQLEHNAFHDPLTGLPNRALFLDHLSLAISRGSRDSSHQFAVLFIDLDRFKLINDSLGHQAGDQLLMEVAQRLQNCIRATDTVSRLGGDEFALLLDGVGQWNDVPRAIERIRIALQAPILLQEAEVFTTASIGVALSTKEYLDIENPLRDADTAMYRAKSKGPGNYQVFDQSMHESAVKRLRLDNDLRRALGKNELVVYYQPIVITTSQDIVAFEALIRWQHPEQGLLGPMEFLQIAEDTDLIMPITDWVLEASSRQIAEWKKEFPNYPHLSVSVNLSPKYFMRKELHERIRKLLSKSGLTVDSLTLEITEGQIMVDPPSVTRMMEKLRDMGIRVHIDDFGTGYSSLAYLTDLPVSGLKIDRVFTSRIGSDERNASVIKSILSLGNILGLEVIAEGVETREQLDYLTAHGCKLAQGYFFARPIPPDEATKLLQSSIFGEDLDDGTISSFPENFLHRIYKRPPQDCPEKLNSVPFAIASDPSRPPGMLRHGFSMPSNGRTSQMWSNPVRVMAGGWQGMPGTECGWRRRPLPPMVQTRVLREEHSSGQVAGYSSKFVIRGAGNLKPNSSHSETSFS